MSNNRIIWLLIIAVILIAIYCCYRAIEKFKKSKKLVSLLYTCVALLCAILSLIIAPKTDTSFFSSCTRTTPEPTPISETASPDIPQSTTTTEGAERTDQPPEIIIGIGEMEMKPGSNYKVAYTMNTPEAYNYKLIWESSNEECATVDSSGVISAIDIGESIISVSFSEFPDLPKKEFRVFVLDSASPNSELSIDYHYTVAASRVEGYYIFYDIDNPLHINLKKHIIKVYSDSGVMVHEDIIDPPSSTWSNFAGLYNLDYNGTYVVVGSVIAEDGTEYKSDAHVLRLYDEVEENKE